MKLTIQTRPGFRQVTPGVSVVGVTATIPELDVYAYEETEDEAVFEVLYRSLRQLSDELVANKRRPGDTLPLLIVREPQTPAGPRPTSSAEEEPGTAERRTIEEAITALESTGFDATGIERALVGGGDGLALGLADTFVEELRRHQDGQCNLRDRTTCVRGMVLLIDLYRRARGLPVPRNREIAPVWQLHEGHPSIGTRCALCGEFFLAGDESTVLRGSPEGEAAEQAAKGLPHIVSGPLVHLRCWTAVKEGG